MTVFALARTPSLVPLSAGTLTPAAQYSGALLAPIHGVLGRRLGGTHQLGAFVRILQELSSGTWTPAEVKALGIAEPLKTRCVEAAQRHALGLHSDTAVHVLSAALVGVSAFHPGSRTGLSLPALLLKSLLNQPLAVALDVRFTLEHVCAGPYIQPVGDPSRYYRLQYTHLKSQGTYLPLSAQLECVWRFRAELRGGTAEYEWVLDEVQGPVESDLQYTVQGVEEPLPNPDQAEEAFLARVVQISLALDECAVEDVEYKSMAEIKTELRSTVTRCMRDLEHAAAEYHRQVDAERQEYIDTLAKYRVEDPGVEARALDQSKRVETHRQDLAQRLDKALLGIEKLASH